MSEDQARELLEQVRRIAWDWSLPDVEVAGRIRDLLRDEQI